MVQTFFLADESYLPAKRKVLSCQIQMNTFVNNTDGRKRSKCDRNIHKGIRIPVDIY